MPMLLEADMLPTLTNIQNVKFLHNILIYIHYLYFVVVFFFPQRNNKIATGISPTHCCLRQPWASNKVAEAGRQLSGCVLKLEEFSLCSCHPGLKLVWKIFKLRPVYLLHFHRCKKTLQTEGTEDKTCWLGLGCGDRGIFKVELKVAAYCVASAVGKQRNGCRLLCTYLGPSPWNSTVYI